MTCELSLVETEGGAPYFETTLYGIGFHIYCDMKYKAYMIYANAHDSFTNGGDDRKYQIPNGTAKIVFYTEEITEGEGEGEGEGEAVGCLYRYYFYNEDNEIINLKDNDGNPPNYILANSSGAPDIIAD